MEYAMTTHQTKIKHMGRGWSTPQNFFFGIYWWTWKTTIYKKMLKWANKKTKRVLILTILHFKKSREKHLETLLYTCVPKTLDDMINISWDVERGLKLVILGNFLAFYPPKNPRNEILKKWKKVRVISSFYTL